MTFFLILLLILNAAISWWNAHVTGKIWLESKALGGFARLLAWSGAIQSACGFTVILAAVIGFLVLPATMVGSLMSLIYLLVILPVLGSGIVITIHSWIAAYRSRKWTDIGIATWNTLAMRYDRCAHTFFSAITLAAAVTFWLN